MRIFERYKGYLIIDVENPKTELRGIDLTGADLSGAKLGGADFRGTILIGADLSGAKLRRASFRRADLRGASFRGANLSYADFEGADYRGADFRESKHRMRGAKAPEDEGFDWICVGCYDIKMALKRVPWITIVPWTILIIGGIEKADFTKFFREMLP